MKVIVIDDSDGHTTAIQYTTENLVKLLIASLESGRCDDSTRASALLAKQATAEELEEFLTDECWVNSRSSQSHILEVTDWSYRYNPFE